MTVSMGDAIRATGICRFGTGVTTNNCFVARYDDIIGASDDDVGIDLALWLDDIFDGLVIFLVTSFFFESIGMFNLSDGNPMPGQPWPTQDHGTEAATHLPEGNALVVSAATGLSRVIGKKFFPGMGAPAQVAGQFLSVVVIAGVAAGVKWITPFAAASGRHYTPGVWSIATSTFRPFLSVTGRNIVGYQRRRKQGVGA